MKLMSKKEYNAIKDGQADGASTGSEEDSLEVRIIEALGGADNIETVTCCASRLRVTVKDDTLIASDDDFKNYLEAMGVVHAKNAVQVIYGVRVQGITTKVKDILHLD